MNKTTPPSPRSPGLSGLCMHRAAAVSSFFSHIHFWKHRRMQIPPDAQARVLAKFDDSSPALAQIPVGQGNLLVLASGWNPPDSQLALSSQFPPLMQTMLDWSGGAVPARFQFETGEVI